MNEAHLIYLKWLMINWAIFVVENNELFNN